MSPAPNKSAAAMIAVSGLCGVFPSSVFAGTCSRLRYVQGRPLPKHLFIHHRYVVAGLQPCPSEELGSILRREASPSTCETAASAARSARTGFCHLCLFWSSVSVRVWVHVYEEG